MPQYLRDKSGKFVVRCILPKDLCPRCLGHHDTKKSGMALCRERRSARLLSIVPQKLEGTKKVTDSLQSNSLEELALDLLFRQIYWYWDSLEKDILVTIRSILTVYDHHTRYPNTAQKCGVCGHPKFKCIEQRKVKTHEVVGRSLSLLKIPAEYKVSLLSHQGIELFEELYYIRGIASKPQLVDITILKVWELIHKYPGNELSPSV